MGERGRKPSKTSYGQLVAPPTVSWSRFAPAFSCAKARGFGMLSTVSWSRPPRSVGRGHQGKLWLEPRSVGRTNLYSTYMYFL